MQTYMNLPIGRPVDAQYVFRVTLQCHCRPACSRIPDTSYCIQTAKGTDRVFYLAISFHISIVTYPVATKLPSHWNPIPNTSLEWPSCSKSSSCRSTSQSRQVPSKEALPRYRPEGWKAMRATRRACPSRVAKGVSLPYHLSITILAYSFYLLFQAP